MSRTEELPLGMLKELSESNWAKPGKQRRSAGLLYHEPCDFDDVAESWLRSGPREMNVLDEVTSSAMSALLTGHATDWRAYTLTRDNTRLQHRLALAETKIEQLEAQLKVQEARVSPSCATFVRDSLLKNLEVGTGGRYFDPAVSCDDGIYMLEWWSMPRALSIFIGDEVEYFRQWGRRRNEKDDGLVVSPEHLVSLWNWLNGTEAEPK